MPAVRLDLINRGELEESDACYAKLEPLWARLLEEREVKYRKLFAKLDDNRAKIDTDQEKREAGRKTFYEIMERRKAGRKVYDENMVAKWEADREKRKAERKADREVAERLETIHEETDANQMRLEPETEHQEKVDAWIADIKDGRKEKTACQEATEANPEKLGPDPGEMEAVVERQEIPN
jgi:hypothetical protein